MAGSRRNERRIAAASALCALLGFGLGSAIACSDGTDVTVQVNGNTADPAAPGDGVLTGSPVPDSPLPSGAGEGPAPLPQAGPGAPSTAPEESPPPVQAPPAEVPSASGGEPQPSATETNFFGAGCRNDADCGENRRCEFPVEADAGAAPSPGTEGEASPDAGSDAAAPEALVPRGHCVAS